MEDQITPPLDWIEDPVFVTKMENRINRYNAGTDTTYTINEAKPALHEMKVEYMKALVKPNASSSLYA